MKFFLAILLFCATCQPLLAQDLSGSWNGEFDTNYQKGAVKYKIILVIKLNADSSYEALSYTPDLIFHQSGTYTVCNVAFKKLRKNFFRLEEIDEKETNKERLQTMFLKYRIAKGKEILKGNWESGSGKSRVNGYIQFIKVDDIKIENQP